ncbi:histidine kinase [Rhizobium sp. C4]|uniref:histidine kinase n=1 Tax=Rhizobium sp. C4 TaxID=1349800 RepID=UPI001E2997C8|nr:histidine kinase [Rhizobium sp. C4]MCD2175315.1 histidine kinase [Rhizobium sp. C4]
MKKLIIAVSAALLFVTAAHAKQWDIPSNRPVATLNMPSGWKTSETATGIEGTSEDDAVYFSVDLASPKKMDGIIDDAAKFLDDQGIKIDTNTQKYSEDKLNGKDIVYISWSGTDKDGPASIGLAVLILDEKTVLVLTYWGTQGEEDKHMPEIGKILDSIKLAQ